MRDEFEKAKAIHSRLSSCNRIFLTDDRLKAHGLHGVVSSQLVTALGDEESVYVSVAYRADEKLGPVVIVALTPTRLLRVVANTETGAAPVRVVSRRTLAAMTINSGPDFVNGAGGDLSVTLDYPEFAVELPGDRYATPRNLTGLGELLPSLATDLAAV